MKMNNLDYAIIGNCKSAALISKYGSIDWCCLPEFNSSSVFAKILDENKGGSFEVYAEGFEIFQDYIPRTNILVTRYTRKNDSFEFIDFMPRYINENGSFYCPPDLIRFIRLLSGKPKFKLKFNPKLEYAKNQTIIVQKNKYIKSYTESGTYDSLYLYTNLDKEKIIQSKEIVLEQNAFCLLSYNQKILEQNSYRCYLKMQRTKVYWLNWSEKTKTYREYNDQIMRSALVLKLLSFEKSGAVLAAATTSLPETIGEVRNWDYRFCWMRDASMVIRVMSELGHVQVAGRYLKFILNIIPDKDEKIQIMYGINGEKKLTEVILDHLEGYQGSAPVRIGNAAYKQKQNDIYGVLMDVLYQQFQVFNTSLENSEALWTITRSVVRIVKNNWQKPDKGIWEIRTEEKHFTFSKVLCWVAIDRAIRIAELLNMNEYIREWSKLAEKIMHDVLKNAWNEEKQAFTQAYGTTDLDAANLLMESYGFIEARDPKFVSTVDASFKELSYNGLMYRYKNKDDFGTPSSAFTICSFWMANSLYKIGRRKQAKDMFENLLTYSNHVGLFSEDIDFDSKRLLGNFPQAYSHLALIETAIILSEGDITSDEEIIEALTQ